MFETKPFSLLPSRSLGLSLFKSSQSIFKALTIKNTFNIAFRTIITAYYHPFFAYSLTINTNFKPFTKGVSEHEFCT